MNSPNNIPATITRRWTIFRPPIYRYLKPARVTEFFETGRLRLSSFVEFTKHPDEERKDGAEGKNFLYFQNREAGFGVGAMLAHGQDAYIWCGCMQFDPDRMARWGGSYIRIDNTVAFAAAISSHIAGFREGLEGPCLYLDNRMLLGNSGQLTQADLMSEEKMDPVKMMAIPAMLAGAAVFFTKLRRHAGDQEYRFVWLASRVQNDLVIECPEARQFCSAPPK